MSIVIAHPPTAPARRMLSRALTCLVLGMFAGLLPAARAQTPARICHVAPEGTQAQDGQATNDGRDWRNALTLQAALGQGMVNGQRCTDIRIKQGIYKPGNTRNSSFAIGRPLQLRGGYTGNPDLPGERGTRARDTVLSGDVDNNDRNVSAGITASASDIAGNNSYHVVLIGGNSLFGGNGSYTPVETDGNYTLIERLTITAGDADANGLTANRAGGGLFCNGGGNGRECSPALRDIWFSGNRANFGGALMNMASTLNSAGGRSSPHISGTTFSGNTAVFSGGAINNAAYPNGDSSPVITQSTFLDNRADDGQSNGTGDGGALYNDATESGTSSPVITHSTFSGNRAQRKGSALYNSHSLPGVSAPTITASILRTEDGAPAPLGDDSAMPAATLTNNLIRGGWAGPGSGNTDADPQLGPLGDHGGPTPTLRPLPGSPALDAVPCAADSATDQRGVSRPQGARCDAGAVEVRAFRAALTARVSGAGTIALGGATPPASDWTGNCTGANSPCQALYDYTETLPAATVNLTATPDSGHVFAGWGGACDGKGTCQVTMDQARSVTAGFVPLLAISASASPAAAGTASCDASQALPGATVTCIASAPHSGFAFVGWRGNDACVTGNTGSTCAMADVQASKTLTALYRASTLFTGTTMPTPGTAGRPGTATASFTGGSDTCRFDAAATAFEAAPAPPPAGRTLPQGMFRFRLTGCDTGATVHMSITWPQPAQDLVKHGLAQPTDTARSYFSPSGTQIDGPATRFDVTDGQRGDDDWTADGHITDLVGPATTVATAAGPTPIPTLGAASLALLALLMAGAALMSSRRTRP